MKSYVLKSLVLLISLFGLSLLAYAGPKVLIKYSGGKVTPVMATAAKSAGAGKYEFTLGKGVTPDMVKSSLEKKLKSFNAKVSPKGANAVLVSYTGAEADFLKKVSKVRIKSGGASLAVESSVSDGGIRAKTSARGPKPDEVKGQVLAVSGDSIKMVVTAAGPKSGAKNGQVISVSGRGSFTPKKKDIIFFKKVSSAPWKGAQFTDK